MKLSGEYELFINSINVGQKKKKDILKNIEAHENLLNK